MRKADYLKPLPDDYWSLCKRELAEIRMGEITFDYAIPKGWLDAYVQSAGAFRASVYDMILSECVTAYPPGEYFGQIVNLISGEILN